MNFRCFFSLCRRCALTTWKPTNFISFEFINVAIENRRHNVYIGYCYMKRVRNMILRYDSIRSILGWVFHHTNSTKRRRRRREFDRYAISHNADIGITYECARVRCLPFFSSRVALVTNALCAHTMPCVADGIAHTHIALWIFERQLNK